mmetsp:Transcript_143931/g.460003  ORF Transcript_143931/g.460003 Transcript_143931/m.460003 type:complete len:114 (-) Transcript_143931:27-368(-)
MRESTAWDDVAMSRKPPLGEAWDLLGEILAMLSMSFAEAEVAGAEEPVAFEPLEHEGVSVWSLSLARGSAACARPVARFFLLGMAVARPCERLRARATNRVRPEISARANVSA